MNPEQSTKLCNVKYKIVFLGEMNTGKTSIIDRFAKNSFQQHIQQTIGIDLVTRNLSYNKVVYKLQLWDTAGQQKYRSIVPNYIRDAHCAVFVYDITDEKTLNNLCHWQQMFKNYQPEGAIAILVGNKLDRKDKRQVDVTKGIEWAKKYDMAFAEVSAKTGQGVEDVFHSIVENIDISDQPKTERQPTTSTRTQNEQRKHETSKVERKNSKIQSQNSELSFSGRLNKKPILQLKEKKRDFACCYI